LTGDIGDLSSSRNKTRPLVITQAFLFKMSNLMPRLKERGVKIGIATSLRNNDWIEAMIYPDQNSKELVLSSEQKRLLNLFEPPSDDVSTDSLFVKVCDIEPVKDGSTVYGYKPYLRYANRKGLELHSYGEGPFCSFRIPNEYNGKTGVYLLKINGDIVYVGKTNDLGIRFNQGYGNISPRNCYMGGPETNCRINNLILEEIKKGQSIELFFYETDDIDSVELSLISEKKPGWNLTSIKIPNESKKVKNKIKYTGKYYKLGEYLENLDSEKVTLSYGEVEGILGFKLPNSAKNHNAWWSNGGHDHSRAWNDYGWASYKINLGKSISFRKM
jgi:hypothetical protein